MKKMKKIISILLVAMILVNLVPVDVFATPDTEPETTTKSNMNIEGTNSFGNLVSKDLTEYQMESEAESDLYSMDYTVTDLVVELNSATVTYDALEKALLIVALYTEDGIQLLNSAQTLVDPEETTAVVTFEGEMPEYFRAAAYLVDSFDLTPLCASYETPVYTSAMQELLDSTVEDYDSDRVWNLDDDITTNFAVYEESTIVIQYVPGVNKVVDADDESATYVIENADESFTTLQRGDIFSYHYGENEVLIAKVDTIKTEGTTVTITGAETELEDVFSYMKIEADGENTELKVEESTCGEGITYAGLMEKDFETYSLQQERAFDFEGNIKPQYHVFPIDKKIVNKENVKVDVKGSVGLDIKAELKFYISLKEQYIKLNADFDIGFKISVSGEVIVTGDDCKLPEIGFTPVPGVLIGFEPRIELKFSAKITWNVGVVFAIGFQYDGDVKNLCKKPELESKLKFEGTVFLGIDLHPKIGIAADKVAEISLKSMLGIELTGKSTGTLTEISTEVVNEKHGCKGCIKGDIGGKFEFGGAIKLLDWEKLKIGLTFPAIKLKFCDFYYSYDHDDLGLGLCPYKEYLLTIIVKDDQGKVLKGVKVETINNTNCGTTNRFGVTEVFLAPGEYTLKALSDGKWGEHTVKITEPGKTVLQLNYDENETPMGPEHEGGGLSFPDYVYEENDAEDIIDVTGEVAETGKCGAEGNDVTWTFYDNGVLLISGSGEMGKIYANDSYQKYKNDIVKVVITSGITKISNAAFNEFGNIREVELPSTLKTIGSNAFGTCVNLTCIRIPEGVTTIENNVFLNCTSLGDIELPNTLKDIGYNVFTNCTSLESIKIPEGIEELDDSTFLGCTNLRSVKLPDTLKSIGDSAFSSCENLESIVIPEGVTEIGRYVFNGCGNLITVTLPTTLTDIKEYAFYSCKRLQKADLPSKLKHIGESAFYGCNKLESVTLPSTLLSLGQSAFSKCNSISGEIRIPDKINKIEQSVFGECENLTKVILPETLLSIGYNAFWCCTNLESINIPEKLTEINDHAFYMCEKLNGIELPDTLNTLGTYAFLGCTSLESINIPEKITEINLGCFQDCTNLTTVELPSRLYKVAGSAFMNCEKLKSISFPEGFSSIGGQAFSHCTSLTSLELPSTLETVNMMAFSGCENLETVKFSGPLPEIGDYAFYPTGITTIYYPENENGWLEYIADNSSADITWIPYTPAIATVVNEEHTISTYAAFGGEYGTEESDDREVKTASFKDLVPGGKYLLLAVKSLNAENVVSDENLLYIAQDAATEDGTLYFRYVHREESDIAFVIVCGPSAKNLQDAQITFPEMIADNETQAVAPLVVYDGKMLVEGQDYTLSGVISFAKAGEYICYVKGIHNYTGLVECVYNVRESGNGPEVSGNFVERIAGKTRYETSIKIADAYKESIGVSKFEAVIISCGTEFADALAGSYLASVKNAPILMYNNKPGKSNAETLAAYVKENLNTNGTVYLLGGAKAVGNDIEQALVEYHVKRLAGGNRYETNLEILTEAGVGNQEILVCTGQNFADSLSGSATQKPILLVNNKKGVLTDGQKKFLDSLSGNKLYVVGGNGAVSTEIESQLKHYGEVERIGGKNRYETSVMLAETFFDEPSTLVLTYGKNFPDGLCGGMLAISKNAPLILTISNKYSAWAEDYSAYHDIKGGVVLGGNGLIEDQTVRNIFDMQDGENIVLK